MYVRQLSFPFKGTNNIKYLERILGISIMSEIHNEIKVYIENLNNGICFNDGKMYNYDFILNDKDKSLSNISYVLNGYQESIIEIKNGLPYSVINRSEKRSLFDVGVRLKPLNQHTKLKLTPPFMKNFDELNFEFNLSEITSQIQSKINELTEIDYKIISEDLMELKRINPKISITNKIKNLVLLRTNTRINSYKSNKSINLLDLISYELTLYTSVVNSNTVFWIMDKIKKLFYPKFKSIKESKLDRYNIISKMKLKPKLMKALMAIPDNLFKPLANIFIKYPLCYYLIENYKDLLNFDTENLIINDAHPKHIAKLITDFYVKNSVYEIPSKIVTKILRLNKSSIIVSSLLNHDFIKDYYNDEYSPFNDFLSIEFYLMIFFSNMHEVNLLNMTKINKKERNIELTEYYNINYIYHFCRSFANVESAIKISKSTYQSIKFDQSLSDELINSRVEIVRLYNYLSSDGNNQFQDFLCKIMVWSKKKLKILHDNTVLTISEILKKDEIKRLDPDIVTHINDKIIEPITIDGFNFEQLTLKDELIEESHIMTHCVRNYYAENYNNKLFIFRVRPLKEQEKFDFSTISIYVNEKEIHLSQNKSLGNLDPSNENKKSVTKFISNLKEKNISDFFNYNLKSNELKKITVKKYQMEKPTFNEYIGNFTK